MTINGRDCIIEVVADKDGVWLFIEEPKETTELFVGKDDVDDLIAGIIEGIGICGKVNHTLKVKRGLV